MPKMLYALMLLLLTTPSVALAHTPLGGLTVAVSPDGKTVVAGGDTRTLYVLDAASLEVTRRVWLGTTIWRLTFDKDGAHVLVEDTSSTLWLVETKGWTFQEVAKKTAFISPARQVNLCAAYDEYYQTATGRQPAIKLLSMTDGAVVHTLPLGAGARIAGLGLSPDGTRVAVLFARAKDAEEPNVPYGKIPRDLQGLERTVFRQKNDGQTARFRLLEVAGGKTVREGKLWFSASGRLRLLFAGEDVLVTTYDNANARIASDLSTELFALSNSFNYAIGHSDDHKILLTGGLRKGTRASQGPDGALTQTTFELDKLPGWPEYYSGFAVAADGTGFAGTTAYRVARIAADGKVQTIARVTAD